MKIWVVLCLLLSSFALAEPFTVNDGISLGRSSVLNGPNGVYAGPDGNIYVASVLGNEITVHDPRNGKVLDRIGSERGVYGPDDLVIAPDGTLYWTELIPGNVGMLKPDGTLRKQFVGPGVNPITLSDDGRLFVARDFLGDGLYELDPELRADPVVIIADLVGLNGMDFGPDGLLYGPLFFAGKIVRIDVDAVAPSPETVATGFRVPGAVAFNSAGQLHAVDFAAGQLIRVDVGSGDWEVLADIEGNLDNLAFDAKDRLFTTAFGDGQLLTLTPGGTLRALNKPGFIAPGGVAAGADGTVWVGDFFSLRGMGKSRNAEVSFYDRFDPPGVGAGIASVNTVAIDNGLLVTSGWFSNTVQVVDPATGKVLEDIRNLATPTNAIVHGSVLVAAQAGANNVVNARTGTELIGGLGLPLGLASDGSTLYVADWATGLVWALASDGTTAIIASGLAQPEGLALDGDRLLVVEEGLDRVVAIKLDSGEVMPVIEGLDLGAPAIPKALPNGIFNGIAVAADGALLVSADGTNSVYMFKRSAAAR